jgi:hypothetical protein
VFTARYEMNLYTIQINFRRQELKRRYEHVPHYVTIKTLPPPLLVMSSNDLQAVQAVSLSNITAEANGFSRSTSAHVMQQNIKCRRAQARQA